MVCPSCQSPTRVLESRAADAGAATRRRRACPGCGRRFTTYERREPDAAFVRKRSGDLVPFDRAKLREALQRAAHKRPVSAAAVEAIVGRVEAAVRDADGELPTKRVGEICLEELQRLDGGAYLQFAGTLPDPLQIAPIEQVGSVRAEREHG